MKYTIYTLLLLLTGSTFAEITDMNVVYNNSDANNSYYSVNINDNFANNRIFELYINADGNKMTGYGDGIGAEYLITANKSLIKYTGPNGGWSDDYWNPQYNLGDLDLMWVGDSYVNVDLPNWVLSPLSSHAIFHMEVFTNNWEWLDSGETGIAGYNPSIKPIPVGSTFEWVIASHTSDQHIGDRVDASTYGRDESKPEYNQRLLNTFTADDGIDVVDVDGFGTTKETVQALKDKGKIVIAYLKVGAADGWRPHVSSNWEEVASGQTTPNFSVVKDRGIIIGGAVGGYPLERYFSIHGNSRLDKVLEFLSEHFDMVKEKGFDGIEPDVLEIGEDIRGGNTGNTLNDVKAFANALIKMAHDRSLSIGHKNAERLVDDYSQKFDWALVENYYNPSDDSSHEKSHSEWDIYINQNKAVFMVEYSKNHGENGSFGYPEYFKYFLDGYDGNNNGVKDDSDDQQYVCNSIKSHGYYGLLKGGSMGSANLTDLATDVCSPY